MCRVCLIVCLACVLLTPVVSRADVVTDWNNTALDIIKANDIRPPYASRALAMVHTAVYDAVNSIYGAYQPYYTYVPVYEPTTPEIAAAVAAYVVLAGLYPNEHAALYSKVMSTISAFPDGTPKNNAISLGLHCGYLMFYWRQNDGWDIEVPYTPGHLPGNWQPTPPGFGPPLVPNWPFVTPFALASADQFRPGPPPPLTSPQYAAGCNEVKLLGKLRSTARTDDQAQTAYFWANNSRSVTPPGRWNIVAQIIAKKKYNNLYQNARLFALLNIALADAAIAAWDCKYAYNLWRPSTAITNANLDGNPSTVRDYSWAPLLPDPSFPEYVSGHSTFGAAASTVLTYFFGRNDIPFRLPTDTPLARDRSFTSFSHAAYENGRSRIYGGIHFEFGNVEGLKLGYLVGSYACANYMTPAVE